jgi:hypothetical protein
VSCSSVSPRSDSSRSKRQSTSCHHTPSTSLSHASRSRSTSTTSIFKMPSGDPRSSRLAPTCRIRCASASTATSGSNSSSFERRFRSIASTTASCGVPIPIACSSWLIHLARPMYRRSSIAGSST